MYGMCAPPEVVRRQCHHSNRSAHPVICQAMSEKRSVTAIVKPTVRLRRTIEWPSRLDRP
jgi:hypothetical protein